MAKGDVIKAFRWGGYPGLSGWARCNHKGPYKRKAEGDLAQQRKRCCDDGSRGWRDAVQRWRKGP